MEKCRLYFLPDNQARAVFTTGKVVAGYTEAVTEELRKIVKEGEEAGAMLANILYTLAVMY